MLAKYPSVHLQAGQLSHTHKMEYYSTIKRNTVRHVPRINLKSVLLNKEQAKMDCRGHRL